MKKQILAALLVIGNLIAGCGGSDDVTEAPKAPEAPKENNYTEWVSLLKNSSKDDGKMNPLVTLKDGRIIIGSRGDSTDLQGSIERIEVLPSSYSSNPGKFNIEELADNRFDITLNESIGDKPKVAFYIPDSITNELNKEKFQNILNKTLKISFIRNIENPINIPFKLIHTPENEYWIEISLIGSGQYLLEFDEPPQE